MSLMSRVIDFMDSDNHPRWLKGNWGHSYEEWDEVEEKTLRVRHDTACIMGIVGLVLQGPMFLIGQTDYVELLAALMSQEEEQELRVLLDVVKENYPQWWAMYDSLIIHPLTRQGVVNALIAWNDHETDGAKSFEDDILPMLEKAAIRAAEQGV